MIPLQVSIGKGGKEKCNLAGWIIPEKKGKQLKNY